MTVTVDTLTDYSRDRDITTIPQWFCWEVEYNKDWNEADTGQTMDLISLPIGSIVHDLKIQCVLQDTGATTSVVSVLLETLTTVLCAGTADNMGATGVTDVLEIDNIEAFPLAAADTLQAQFDLTGDGMTVGPKVRISAVISRIARPS